MINPDPLIILQNNAPIDEFCGLSPNEMHNLLYDSLGEKSPVKIFNEIDDTICDRIPFLRLTEEFLKIVQREKNIKLTPKGALPRKILQELYDYKIIVNYFVEQGISKINREIDWVALQTVHINSRLMRVLKISNNKLSLTKKGEQLLEPKNRIDLLKETLITFTNKFNWSFNDRYLDDNIGQLGCGYTLYLFLKFGDTEETIESYANKYLRAFPQLLGDFPDMMFIDKQKGVLGCYEHRTFSRFLEWFGFVNISQSHEVFDRHLNMVSRTDVFDKVFYLDTV